MPKAKKQHYVPQFYLKNFTQDGEHLFVYDKIRRESFKTNLSNVASGSYFYDIPQEAIETVKDPVDPQIIEKTLAKYEAHFASALDTMLRTIRWTGRINHEQKSAMAFFMAIQFLRTRESRTYYMEIIRKGMKAVAGIVAKSKRPDLSIDDIKVDVSEKSGWAMQAKMLFSLDDVRLFAQALNNHIWLIGVNETGKHLYTSDHPVVREPHKMDPFLSYAGVASEGIEIAFPLSPQYILILCERKFHWYVEGLEGKAIRLQAENIKYYNSLQVFQSYRQVYCPSDTFYLAERICKEHPEVCAPDRDRVQVTWGSKEIK